MNIEDRLKDELDREGRRPVDVDSLYASTRERIDSGRGSRRVTPVLAVAASAVAVLGIAGGGLWLDQWQGSDPGRSEQAWGSTRGVAVDRAKEGDVDDAFRCPDTVMLTDFLRRELFGGGPDMGVGFLGADRYQLIRRGDTALMRAGKADGTLTAKIHLVDRRGWVLDRVERCTGPEGSDVPVGGRFELGEHGREFPKAPRPSDYDPAADSSVVPIDDRPYYNRIGIKDRRTFYAYESGDEVVVPELETELDFRELGGYHSFGPNHMVELGDFIDEYGRMTWQSDFLFAGYYTTDSATVTAELEDGSTVDAKAIRGDDWKGTLYALLAPRAEVEKVIVERDGRTKSYEPGQIG